VVVTELLSSELFLSYSYMNYKQEDFLTKVK